MEEGLGKWEGEKQIETGKEQERRKFLPNACCFLFTCIGMGEGVLAAQAAVCA
jgi:hypothetical protein